MSLDAPTAREIGDRLRAGETRRDELEAVVDELRTLEARRLVLALELVDDYGWSLRSVADVAGTSPATLHRQLVIGRRARKAVRSRNLNERKGA